MVPRLCAKSLTMFDFQHLCQAVMRDRVVGLFCLYSGSLLGSRIVDHVSFPTLVPDSHAR
jgi:hypothetical protein